MIEKLEKEGSAGSVEKGRGVVWVWGIGLEAQWMEPAMGETGYQCDRKVEDHGRLDQRSKGYVGSYDPLPYATPTVVLAHPVQLYSVLPASESLTPIASSRCCWTGAEPRPAAMR